MARPKVWTAEEIATVAPEICRRLALGEGLRAICRRQDGMPDEGTVMGWAIDGDPAHEEFARQYARARAIQVESMFDELVEIADEAVDSQSAAAQRLKYDARRWAMSKILPKKYGDKLDVTTGGEKLPGPAPDLSRLSPETLRRAIEELEGADAGDGERQ